MLPPHAAHLDQKRRHNTYDTTDVYRKGEGDRDHQKDTKKTNMVIRSFAAWQGVYPILRELLQNAIDYLELVDPDGNLKEFVTLSCSSNSIQFSERDTPLLRIEFPTEDTLVIWQNFTFPLATEALGDGVEDPTKQGAHANAAGGFGVGAKDSARAILHKQGALLFTFFTETEKITWKFVAKEQPRVSRLQAHPTLNVKTEIRTVKRPQPFTMTQTVTLANVRNAFLTEVVPRVSIFWSRVDAPLRILNDYLAPPPSLAAPFAAISGCAAAHAHPGVYVRGLFVQSFRFLPRAVVMAGASSPVNVTSRDRNTVHEHVVVARIRGMFTATEYSPVIHEKLQYVFDGTTNDSWLGTETAFWATVFAPDRLRVLWKHLGFAANMAFVDPVELPRERWILDTTAAMGIAHTEVSNAVSNTLFPRTRPFMILDEMVAKLRADPSKLVADSLLTRAATLMVTEYIPDLSHRTVAPLVTVATSLRVIRHGREIVILAQTDDVDKTVLTTLCVHLTALMDIPNDGTSSLIAKLQSTIAALPDDVTFRTPDDLESLRASSTAIVPYVPPCVDLTEDDTDPPCDRPHDPPCDRPRDPPCDRPHDSPCDDSDSDSDVVSDDAWTAPRELERELCRTIFSVLGKRPRRELDEYLRSGFRANVGV